MNRTRVGATDERATPAISRTLFASLPFAARQESQVQLGDHICFDLIAGRKKAVTQTEIALWFARQATTLAPRHLKACAAAVYAFSEYFPVPSEFRYLRDMLSNIEAMQAFVMRQMAAEDAIRVLRLPSSAYHLRNAAGVDPQISTFLRKGLLGPAGNSLPPSIVWIKPSWLRNLDPTPAHDGHGG